MAKAKPAEAAASNLKGAARRNLNLVSGADTKTEGFVLAVQKFENALSVNRARGTVTNYIRSARKMLAFLEAKGLRNLQAIRREHVEMWLNAVREEGVKPASLRSDFMGARQFFNYLVEDGEVRDSPMVRLKPPPVPEQTTPIIADDDVEGILAACRRDKTLWGLRDRAIVLTLRWGGLRSAELLGANIDHLEWRDPGIWVTGKGNKTAFVPLTPEAMRAINTYLNRRRQQYERRKHEWERSPALFISHQGGGRLGKSGLFLMLRRRAQEAGLDPKKIRPHAFRHTWATDMRGRGIGEDELRRLGRWTPGSRMVERYTKQTAVQRAVASYRKATSRKD